MLHILFLIIPILIYIALSTAILFHLKRYAIAGDLTQKIVKLFIAVSIILTIFTAWEFFNIPWNELNLAEMIQNTLSNNNIFFQQ